MSQPCHYSGLKPSRVMASVVEWLDGGRAEDKMSAAARLTQQRHMKYRAGKKARALELLQTKDALEATVQSLQDRARSRKPTSLLSWKSISVALKDSRDDSHRQNRDLRAQIHALQRLMSELGAWVDMTKELNPSCPTWRDTNLPQHPESRRMAKAWITQRMLHSTDAMFQQHGFPAWDAPQEDMDVWCDEDFTFSDMGIVCRSRRNYIDQQSLEDSISFIQNDCLAAVLILAPKDTVIVVVLLITYETQETSTQLNTVVTPTGEFVNILCAAFHQGPDRCTLVVRHIVQDDLHAHPSGCRQRSRTMWLVGFAAVV
ncbi:hypothetical protein AaE_005573 [Aphanomyces astaci]|uniref:Uncharacterized protein n=1 Tax=Aphanomyces astaci TaxID=112090 RepID=A0A6A5AFU0_APHAT|nr:hypothetical protein AaE_005573 [Aphanomyces astaci]